MQVSNRLQRKAFLSLAYGWAWSVSLALHDCELGFPPPPPPLPGAATASCLRAGGGTGPPATMPFAGGGAGQVHRYVTAMNFYCALQGTTESSANARLPKGSDAAAWTCTLQGNLRVLHRLFWPFIPCRSRANHMSLYDRKKSDSPCM